MLCTKTYTIELFFLILKFIRKNLLNLLKSSFSQKMESIEIKGIIPKRGIIPKKGIF